MMQAWILEKKGGPLVLKKVEIPKVKEDEILIQVEVCGVCRTDLHILDGELENPKLPLIMGHQIVGCVVEKGNKVSRFKVGDKVGVPWLAKSCGKCDYCKSGHENLCDFALYTGYNYDGGFASYCVAHADFSFLLPQTFPSQEAAPLLCAGMIGYRALRLTEGAKKIGFYGFGVAAHLLIQVVNYRGGEVFAFTRKGDIEGQQFALSLGAVFAADSDQMPPTPLDAAILFAPVGPHYIQALKAVKKGGIVISAGIHMSDIPSFPYALLWGEKVMRTVSNLTRQDGDEFLSLAPKIPVKVQVTSYPFEKLPDALEDQRRGINAGAKVIVV